MADTYKKKEYTESDSVKNLQAEYQKQAANKPSAYQSQWQSQIDSTLEKIQNRQPFSYDANADALYQNYKDSYTRQGQKAMQDTMGQAAAMTGGYGNSYAQTVGQQVYNDYMMELGNMIPSLYQLALDKYNAEGDALYQQYGILSDREGLDYSRYQDQQAQYNADLDRLYSQWQSERDYDYAKFADNRDFDYSQFLNDRNYQYQRDRDAKADSQWQQSFDEAKRQYDQEWAYQQMKDGKLTALEAAELMASVGDYSLLAQYYGLTDEQLKKIMGEDTPVISGTYTGSGDMSREEIVALQQQLGVEADGIWGPQTAAAAQKAYGVNTPTGAWNTLAVEEDYNYVKSNGGSTRDSDELLKSYVDMGIISPRQATEIRNGRR